MMGRHSYPEPSGSDGEKWMDLSDGQLFIAGGMIYRRIGSGSRHAYQPFWYAGSYLNMHVMETSWGWVDG